MSSCQASTVQEKVDHNGPKALWFWGSGIPTGFIWVILLFWASATEVTWWHSTGEWAGLEDLRQLHAHMWCPSGDGWRAELSWSYWPGLPHVASSARQPLGSEAPSVQLRAPQA